VPPGRRLTYDTVKGRLWSVCDRCHCWNLIPRRALELRLRGVEARWREKEALARIVDDELS
jgi:hypothetical protein